MKHTLSILALSLLVCGTAYAAGKGAVEPAAGTLWKEDRTGMRFVWIPSGCFQMGGVGGTSIHKECVKGFWMGRYEVTQAQYQQIMGKNPSYFKGEDNPVEEVSWSEAKTFAEEMSLATGTNVALPSEVQWEYACRAGSQDEYCGGNSVGSVAWYTDNSDDKRLNADLKYAIGSKVPVRTKAKLKAAATDHMQKLDQTPERVKSYFQDIYVKYAA